MKALEPATPCPKCGAKDWSGPRYVHPVRCPDKLAWKCETCGYVTHTPCLDTE